MKTFWNLHNLIFQCFTYINKIFVFEEQMHVTWTNKSDVLTNSGIKETVPGKFLYVQGHTVYKA